MWGAAQMMGPSAVSSILQPVLFRIFKVAIRDHDLKFLALGV